MFAMKASRIKREREGQVGKEKAMDASDAASTVVSLGQTKLRRRGGRMPYHSRSELEGEEPFHDFGSLQIPYASEDAWTRLRDDRHSTNWVAFAIEDGSLVTQGEGQGGLAELVEMMTV